MAGRSPRIFCRIYNRVDRPDEQQLVARLQHLVRRDCRNHLIATTQFREIQPRQVAKARLLDGFPADSSLLLNDHFYRVLPQVSEIGKPGRPVGQEPTAGCCHIEDAQNDTR